MSAQAYQVGAHFEALNTGVLVAPMKMLVIFFISRVAEARWKGSTTSEQTSMPRVLISYLIT